MKKLKVSFIAIVAILAIGVTVAAQAGAFDAKKVFAETDCFTTDIRFKTAIPDCPANTTLAQDGFDCVNIAVNDHIWSLGAIVANPSQTCTGGADLCCVYVVEDLDPCVDQPQLTLGTTPKYFKVGRANGLQSIFCEP